MSKVYYNNCCTIFEPISWLREFDMSNVVMILCPKETHIPTINLEIVYTREFDICTIMILYLSSKE
jgi:hypothetical protein